MNVYIPYVWCGCWGLNLGPLPKKHMLLTAEPSLQWCPTPTPFFKVPSTIPDCVRWIKITKGEKNHMHEDNQCVVGTEPGFLLLPTAILYQLGIHTLGRAPAAPTMQDLYALPLYTRDRQARWLSQCEGQHLKSQHPHKKPGRGQCAPGVPAGDRSHWNSFVSPLWVKSETLCLKTNKKC